MPYNQSLECYEKWPNAFVLIFFPLKTSNVSLLVAAGKGECIHKVLCFNKFELNYLLLCSISFNCKPLRIFKKKISFEQPGKANK